jgi:hypothetical protein
MSQPKIFMPDAHPEERRRVMSDTADKKETGTYIKVLSEEEIYERRELLADSSIKLPAKCRNLYLSHSLFLKDILL